MMRRRAVTILALAAALAASCSSSPPSRFYTLSATAPAAATPSTLVIAVGPVSVPSVVDRPEFVVSTGQNEVKLDDFNRWASPLQDILSRAVAENLVAIVGSPRILMFPQPLAAEPDFRVAIEVRTFESVPGNSATLDAVWTIRRSKDGRTQTGRTSVREKVTEAGYEAIAAAHSRGVARLSQDIADAILGLR